MGKVISYKKISEIIAEDPDTWSADKVFLTFDIDWAHDQVIHDTIDLVEKYNCAATWFVTHNTPVIDRLRENPLFELGIHPNFNALLSGNADKVDSSIKIIENMLKIVPEATAARSHSTTISTNIMRQFAEHGIQYDCNLFIPEFSGISLKPWRNWTNMTMVPYLWEDDVMCAEAKSINIKSIVRSSGLKVFDFHPIHVFLNTENLYRYEKTRLLHKTPKKLAEHRHIGIGTRSRLELIMKEFS